MVRPFKRSRCILLPSACLAAGALAAALSPGFRIYAALAGALAASLSAATCLYRNLRRTRADLDRALHAKSEFLANVSHEFQTPLNGIFGSAQLLAADCDAAERRRLAGAIQASAESLVIAVNEILDFARIEKGEFTVKPGPFDVRAATADVASKFAAPARQKGLQLETAVAPDVPRTVLGDAARVREVLRYLLDNAVKFTSSGNVRVEVSVGGDPVDCRALLFRVRDTGSGMHPAEAAHIFGAFTQADGGSSRRHGGLGLGLALAHRVVALMGGSMGVDTHPGAGSVFWFLLPTAAVEPAPAVPRPDSVLARYGRILVVDDNPINQLVAVRAVHGLGYAADAVPGGESALDALQNVLYDAVIMDCQMPGMDGFQTAREIRRRETVGRLGRLPIIAMTANGPGSDRDECIAAGMDDYLAKPFRIADLDRALERWINSKTSIPSHG